MDKVATVNVSLTDIQSDFATFNSIYRLHFTTDFDALRIEDEAIATI